MEYSTGMFSETPKKRNQIKWVFKPFQIKKLNPTKGSQDQY
jgi:hypothetical protein